MDRLQVEIATYNRAGELAMLLDSLTHQTYKDFDVIIVDGNKENPIRNQHYIHNIITRLKLNGHGVRYVVEEVRNGVASARNLAFKSAFPSKYHCRIDDDSILEPDYLEKLMNLMIEKEGKGEKVGIVGGIVPLFGAPDMFRNSNKLNGYFETVTYTNKGIITSDLAGVQWTPNVILPTHHVRSSYIFTSDVFNDVGGFPEDYGFVGFREETDFCIKAAYKGYKFFCDTGAICWHNRAPYGGCRSPKYMQEVQIGNEHFMRKFMRKFKKDGDPYAGWRPKNN